jgi:hypothetical protein
MTTQGSAGGYTPDDDVKLHSDNAINLICKPFQSHEAGLPEWPKNAADEYARTGAPEDERVIVLLLQNGRAGERPTAIGCLDFSGMTSTVIDETFRHWADPEASSGGDPDAEIQGGHGNGGKCYMVQMFEDRAYLRTVKNRLGSTYGTVSGSIHLGYFPSRDAGRDVHVDDVETDLAKTLSAIGLDIKNLPDAALSALKKRQGYTLMVGLGAKGYPSNKLPAQQIVDNLIEHQQMRRTLELCSVYAITGARMLNDGKPLALPEIPPIPGEDPRVIAIPEKLIDPVTETEVSTTDDGAEPAGMLTLRTSETRMWRGAKKERHVIAYRAKSGYIGYRAVNSFDLYSSYRERIYGECVLRSLEPAKMNDRAALAVSPLVRALEAWIAQEIEKYSKEFEARDRRKHDQEEKDVLAEINAALDSWKNQLLDRVLGETGGGDDDGTSTRRGTRTRLPTGVPARIELSLPHYRAGVGIAMQPQIHAFSAAGEAIRPPAVTWISVDATVADVDESIRVLTTFKPGTTVLHCETFDKAVTSNTVSLEVVEIETISLEPDEIDLPAGSRRRISATCTLSSGEEATNIALDWLENDPNIAAVSSAGFVFGFSEGSTDVTATDENVTADDSVTVTVGPGDADGTSTSAYPRVLISEINADPDTGDEVTLSSDDPPVHQRVVDVERNIWWINSASPLARLYLSDEFGPESREWRIYHLERYIEVIAQIAMTQGPDADDVMDVSEWTARWGERAATIQEAAAIGLASFIHDGDLPS